MSARALATARSASERKIEARTGDYEIRRDSTRTRARELAVYRPFRSFQTGGGTTETTALRMSEGKRPNAFRNRT